MNKTYILNDPEMAKILAVTDDISEANLVQIVSKELDNVTDVFCHFSDDDYTGITQVDVFQHGGLTFEFKVEEIPYYQQKITFTKDLTREEAIKKAAEYHLEGEVTFCIDQLGLEPNVALREWDL